MGRKRSKAKQGAGALPFSAKHVAVVSAALVAYLVYGLVSEYLDVATVPQVGKDGTRVAFQAAPEPSADDPHLRPGMTLGDATDENTRNVFRWLKDEGGFCHMDVVWRTYATKKDVMVSRGTVASKFIAKGELIARIPTSMIIDRPKLRGEDPRHPPSRRLRLVMGMEQYTEWDLLLMFLLEERRAYEMNENPHNLKITNFYLPLLAQTGIYSPVVQSAEEIARMSPLVQEATKTKLELMQRVYERVIVGLAREHYALFAGELETHFSFERYVWAWEMADSRYFNWGFGALMLPLLDLANYGPDYNHMALNKDTDSIEWTAHQDYNPGDEIKFWYGEFCREELLLHYGFDTEESKGCSHEDIFMTAWYKSHALAGELDKYPRAQILATRSEGTEDGAMGSNFE